MSEDCCYNGDAEKGSVEYWNGVYEEEKKHNWLDENQTDLIEMFDKANLDKNASLFLGGVGNAKLPEILIEKGYNNLILNDISPNALIELKNRLPKKDSLIFQAGDILATETFLNHQNKFDIWIDRATLHFFTVCAQKDPYFERINETVKPGGHVLIGVFSKNNEPQCCGLDLQLWSIESLVNRLPNMDLVSERTVNFTENNGTIREYIYVLFKKKVNRFVI